MGTNSQKILNQIQAKKKRFQRLQEGNVLPKKIKDFFHTEIIYTSSDIGGERLSYKQAQEIVSQYPNFKPIKESNKTLLQAKGQKMTLEFIEKFAQRKEPMDIYLIRDLHKMIMNEAWSEIGGVYRQENMEIKKSSVQLPHYSKISEEMYFLNQYLLETQDKLSLEDISGIVEFFTNVRYKLAWIHPFRDGNGRTARFTLNLIARRYGLPYILTPATKVDDRMWQAVQKADKGDLKDLINYHLELLNNSFDVILQ